MSKYSRKLKIIINELIFYSKGHNSCIIVEICISIMESKYLSIFCIENIFKSFNNTLCPKNYIPLSSFNINIIKTLETTKKNPRISPKQLPSFFLNILLENSKIDNEINFF